MRCIEVTRLAVAQGLAQDTCASTQSQAGPRDPLREIVVADEGDVIDLVEKLQESAVMRGFAVN